jgi:6-phosphogluconate dehydrogenase
MQMGMVGLGRMGVNMTRRLLRGGHNIVVFDLDPKNIKQLASEGAAGSSSLEDFVAKLTPPACSLAHGSRWQSDRADSDRTRGTYAAG